MKYFANITTAEELKKEFRALSIKLHPDRNGGDDTEFKAMLSEYESICKNFDSIKEQQEAEREAEEARKEWARREAERKAAEEAEKAKHRPEYLRRCAKWEKLMKEIPAEHKDTKPYFEQTDAEREANRQAAKETTRKRHNVARANILAMVREAFPGVKFTASYNSHWGGGWCISWADGPTAEELRKATDLNLFVSGWDTFDGMTDCAGYEQAMFKDFAKKYNGRSGKISLDRSISKEVRQRISEAIKGIYTLNERGEIDATTLQYNALYEACGITDEESRDSIRRRCMACYMHEISERELLNVICDNLPTIKAEKRQDAPKFTPKHNATYKAVKKAMGAHALGSKTQKGGKWYADNREILDIYRLIDFMPDCGLFFGNVSNYDNDPHWYSFYSSSYANDAKRIARYKAVGIDIKATGEIIAVSHEIVEGLKADREAVEAQRKAWEEAQSEPKAERKTAEAVQPENVAKGETLAEGDGVQLIATEKGAEFTGNTYAHKAEIKALGARWYRLGQCWTIKADKVAEAVELVNSWNNSTPEAEEPEAAADTAEIMKACAMACLFGQNNFTYGDWGPHLSWSDTSKYYNSLKDDHGIFNMLDCAVYAAWCSKNCPVSRLACVAEYGEEITAKVETLYNNARLSLDHRPGYILDDEDKKTVWRFMVAEIEGVQEAEEPEHDTTADTLQDAEEITATAEEPEQDTTAEAEPEQDASAFAALAAGFAALCGELEAIGKATAEEARKTAEKAARATEAAKLREDIATLSAQLASMGEQLRKMSDRLAELTEADENENENENAEAEAPQGATAEDDKNNDPAERERVREKFQRLAEWAEQWTDHNEHTKALRTLCSGLIDRYGDTTLQAGELDTELEQIEKTHNKRGHITPEERNRRDEIQGELIRLTVKEYGEYLAGILWGAGTVSHEMSKAA